MGPPLQHPEIQFTLPALFLGLAGDNELVVDRHALGAVADLVAVVVDVEEGSMGKGDMTPVTDHFHFALLDRLTEQIRPAICGPRGTVTSWGMGIVWPWPMRFHPLPHGTRTIADDVWSDVNLLVRNRG